MRGRQVEVETDSRAYKLLRKIKTLVCAYCPPHRGENAVRVPRHGAKKPRRKNQRRSARGAS